MRSERPKLGILGGMGPQATLELCQRIVDYTAADRDQDHIPTLIYNDTWVPDRTASILGTEEEREACCQSLLQGARILRDAGCTVLAVPCNTSHYFADRLQRELEGMELLHMVRATAETMARRGCRRVGILATDGTVRTGVYQRECEALGMECPALPPEIQARVMSIIYDEIKRGLPGTLEEFLPIDRAVRRELGCDGAILGCTELSVFRTEHRLSGYYLDALDVLARQCVTACGYPLRDARAD